MAKNRKIESIEFKSIKKDKRKFLHEIIFSLPKEMANKFFWLPLIIGGIFITGYYMTFDSGFTPNINLGEASILFLQAFVVGIAIIVIISIYVFATAFAYQFSSIKTNKISESIRKYINKILFLKSIVAQIFSAGIIFPLLTYTLRNEYFSAWVLVFGIGFSLIFCVLFFVLQFFQNKKYKQTKFQSIGDLLIAFCLSFFSILIIFVLSFLTDSHNEISLLAVILVWLTTALYSAVVSIYEKTDIYIPIIMSLPILLSISLMFNIFDLHFKTIAYVLGVAEKAPVTLVFPEKTCKQITSLLKSIDETNKLSEMRSCILKHVNLKNSIGNRWVINAPQKIESYLIMYGEENIIPYYTKVTQWSSEIVFDGEGVIVFKDNQKY
jgi:hypothetical protein